MSSWDGRLPDLNKWADKTQWTDDELAAVIELREHELETEWCATLILQDLHSLRREQERREAASAH